MTTESACKLGTVGFGVVNDYPPTHWRFAGVRNKSCVLEHVKHPSQTTSYPDQFVSWSVVRRIMGDNSPE